MRLNIVIPDDLVKDNGWFSGIVEEGTEYMWCSDGHEGGPIASVVLSVISNILENLIPEDQQQALFDAAMVEAREDYPEEFEERS